MCKSLLPAGAASPALPAPALPSLGMTELAFLGWKVSVAIKNIPSSHCDCRSQACDSGFYKQFLKKVLGHLDTIASIPAWGIRKFNSVQWQQPQGQEQCQSHLNSCYRCRTLANPWVSTPGQRSNSGYEWGEGDSGLLGPAGHFKVCFLPGFSSPA